MPIAGPVSATIIKMAIESHFVEAKAVALGAGSVEMMYSGTAYYGFGSISAMIHKYEVVR